MKGSPSIPVPPPESDQSEQGLRGRSRYRARSGRSALAKKPIGPLNACDLTLERCGDDPLDIKKPSRGIGSKIPEDIYRQAVLLMREGIPKVRIADKYGLSQSTLGHIAKRHSDIIPTHKELMLGKMQEARMVLGDKIVEAVENGRMSPNQYAFAFGTVSQHYSSETGQNIQKTVNLHVQVDKNDMAGLLSTRGSDSHSPAQDSKTPEKPIDIEVRTDFGLDPASSTAPGHSFSDKNATDSDNGGGGGS